MRQTTPFPVPSTWTVYIASGGRPNTTGIMQITSLQNNVIKGTLNFRGNPIPMTGLWNPATQIMQFQSAYVVFQGMLSSTADSIARYWKVNGTYYSKTTSDFPGARGTFAASTVMYR